MALRLSAASLPAQIGHQKFSHRLKKAEVFWHPRHCRKLLSVWHSRIRSASSFRCTASSFEVMASRQTVSRRKSVPCRHLRGVACEVTPLFSSLTGMASKRCSGRVHGSPSSSFGLSLRASLGVGEKPMADVLTAKPSPENGGEGSRHSAIWYSSQVTRLARVQSVSAPSCCHVTRTGYKALDLVGLFHLAKRSCARRSCCRSLLRWRLHFGFLHRGVLSWLKFPRSVTWSPQMMHFIEAYWTCVPHCHVTSSGYTLQLYCARALRARARGLSRSRQRRRRSVR